MNDSGLARRCRQVINNDGILFVNALEMAAGLSPSQPYCVISVLGGQGSGKSTLLNTMFGTTFEVRSAARPDGKVTDGVWLECAQQSTSRTLIFDIEGLDGFERMNDPDLERQFSLLALASADTLLLNIDYRDVERVHGGNLALLRTIIQEKLKLEADQPQAPRHRTTLLTVIRDVPPPVQQNSERRAALYEKHLESIWKELPQHGKDVSLSEYFTLKSFGLPNRVYVEDEFNAQCARLHQVLLAGSGGSQLRQKIPAEQYVAFIERLWAQIRSAEGLRLPSIMAMLGWESCKAAMQHAMESFKGNSTWKEISAVCQEKLLPLPRLSELVLGIIREIMDDYSSRTQYYDSTQAGKCRQKLQLKISKAISESIVDPQSSMMLSFRLQDFSERIASDFEADNADEDQPAHGQPASETSGVNFGNTSTLQAYSSVAAGFIDVLQEEAIEAHIEVICDKYGSYLQQLHRLAAFAQNEPSFDTTAAVVRLRKTLRTMAVAASAQLRAEAAIRAQQEHSNARQRQPAPSESTAAPQNAEKDWSGLLGLGEALCRVVIAGAEAYTAGNNYEPGGRSTSRNSTASSSRQVQGTVVGLNRNGRTVYQGSRGGQYTVSDNGNKAYIKH